MPLPEVVLGDVVRDKVTQVQGTAIARTVWLMGCDRILIQPEVDSSGKVPDSFNVDIGQIEVIGRGRVYQKAVENSGGPVSSPVQNHGAHVMRDRENGFRKP